MDRPPVTRLAPSPTGALHLGNARTFLYNWLVARTLGWRIMLRIEDLDGPRIKPGAGDGLVSDLRWLGIDWDEGPVHQSSRLSNYAGAVEKLVRQKDVYPCVCTRKEVDLAASAPHAEDGSTVYPGTCRGRFGSIEEARNASGREPSLRFLVPPGKIRFVDTFKGAVSIDAAKDLGDFVVCKSDGTPAYQLAVVVDDAAAGVTRVVRGDDLVDSTPRQILLYRALGLSDRIPVYTHLPLVVGPDGRRLAKRHGDSRLEFYRRAGVSRGRVLSLLARWCGMQVGDDVRAVDLLPLFNPIHMPRAPVMFGSDDDRFLRG